jgi:hypothetical protein
MDHGCSNRLEYPEEGMHVENTQRPQEVVAPVPATVVQEKAAYETPTLIVHGKVEKLTLQTG